MKLAAEDFEAHAAKMSGRALDLRTVRALVVATHAVIVSLKDATEAEPRGVPLAGASDARVRGSRSIRRWNVFNALTRHAAASDASRMISTAIVALGAFQAARRDAPVVIRSSVLAIGAGRHEISMPGRDIGLAGISTDTAQ